LGFVADAVFDLRLLPVVAVAKSEGVRGGEVTVRGHVARTPEAQSRPLVGVFRPERQSLSAHRAAQPRKTWMTVSSEQLIIFENVSKFYGEILGVNRVSLEIPAGITSLVGPNGAGKTTLMNLMCGLLRPTRGKLTVLGIPTDQPERLFRKVGYCSQFDSFPRGLTGREFISAFLMVSGFPRREAHELTEGALSRVELLPAADRKIGAYSKGMRQRVRLAQSIAHQPSVLILDEPLNGLDPMVRAETIALFKQLAADGLYLIISSHILHEVDMMSDRVVLLNNGYVVAEGAIHGVRDEMDVEHPMQVLIRCNRPSALAAQMFGKTDVVEARVHDDKQGLFVKTRNPDQFYLSLNDVVAQGEISVESITPVDDDLSAVYEYLIGAQ
jgi:ABC-2 type transport system ATP-binding protein